MGIESFPGILGALDDLFIPYFRNIWDEIPFNDRIEMEGSVLPESAAIAQGHAWKYHATILGVSNQYDLAKKVDYIISNPSHSKPLSNGRYAYYDDLSNTLVIVDPNDPADNGTIYKPDTGIDYYNNNLK